MVEALLLNRDVSDLFLPCPEAMNFREFTFHALELIEDKTTVLLSKHKYRGTQVSCPTLRERRRPVRIGEAFAVILD